MVAVVEVEERRTLAVKGHLGVHMAAAAAEGTAVAVVDTVVAAVGRAVAGVLGAVAVADMVVAAVGSGHAGVERSLAAEGDALPEPLVLCAYRHQDDIRTKGKKLQHSLYWQCRVQLYVRAS